MALLKHRPKHLLEYALLRALGFVFRVLPYRLALAAGWGLAWLAFHVVRWRRREAERRIREVFGPDLPPARVRAIAWRSIRDFIFTMVDSLRLADLDPAWVGRHMTGTQVEDLRRLAAGKGAILVIPHMGSWDLAGAVCDVMDLPVFFIVGSQKNPLTDAYINRMRQSTGVEMVARDSGLLRGVVRRLKEGKILAFMTDLRSKTPGVPVRFLGKEANVVAGMGMFARMADVGVIPVILTRQGWTTHHWLAHEPIFPDAKADRDEDCRRITQAVMDIFDDAVRRHPDQYFWYNKRWVLDPLPPAPPA
ncbi:MAG: hypothetical protein U1F77_10130 [Kiritimatiellia bacterium]